MEIDTETESLLYSLGLGRIDLENALREKDCYRVYTVKKKSGGVRTIAVPSPALKLFQDHLQKYLQKIYAQILVYEGLTQVVHGFVYGKSPLTNALTHQDSNEFFVCDLQNAFTQVDQEKLMAVFDHLVFSLGLSELLTRLVTRNGSIPQGASTSPVLLNLACREMDISLKENKEIIYTRYADDLTFSARSLPNKMNSILDKIGDYGFIVEGRKNRMYCTDNGSAEITGLSVNHPVFQKPNRDHNHRVRLPRSTIRNYRAMLDRAINCGCSLNEVEGKLGWVRMIYGGILPPPLQRPYEIYLHKIGKR